MPGVFQEFSRVKNLFFQDQPEILSRQKRCIVKFLILKVTSKFIKAKDTKRITEFFSRRFGVFMTPLSSEMIIQVDNLQNQSELT